MAVLSLMKSFCPEIRALALTALAALMAAGGAVPSARATSGRTATNEVWIKEIRGTAAISSFPATTWVETQTTNVLHPGDRLRVGPNSVVSLLLSDRSVATFEAGTVLQIRPPHQLGAEPGLHLFQGLLYFFHRGEPNQIQVLTHAMMAGVKGTEFVLKVEVVDGVEQTRIYMMDGVVQVTNGLGYFDVTNGQSAVATVGTAPVRTAGFIARNILQWCLYYPAVLDSSEVPLTVEEREALRESLEAYRSGDLLAALAKYPPGRRPRSDAERVYYAGLLLSVGQVTETEDILSELRTTDALGRIARLAGALRQLIAAVKREDIPPLPSPQLASEFLAASYYAQSRAIRTTSLETALDLANRAKAASPEFGFAWVRVADLEFSFGRTTRAREDLEKGLALTPRNAQALALKGFLLAGQNQTREAIEQFDRALAVDGGLGNAWLGRGLCRIRRGDWAGGREDLLLAAAIEPERSLLRSYLGKAYAVAGETKLATHELKLAKNLDPNDPTSWLYSALLNEKDNRINDAVRDLERSEELNDNRSVYRSGLLLDQDQAVRSANLARIYQEAGMDNVALREASRAVSYDYANYSAHLFLANSYDTLRDPNRINLRFETPAEAEYLIANLLSPASAGVLSTALSQQEYSRLFDQNRLFLSSSTEYLSRGAWNQSASQYGIFGQSSYSLDASYRWDPGQRVNNDFEDLGLSLQFKQQLTSQDTLYFQAARDKSSGGDLYEYYDPSTQANPGLRTTELQEPFLALGYHREWQPGVHTLFLASYLKDTYDVFNPNWLGILANVSNTVPSAVQSFDATQTYRNTIQLYSFEGQQIWQKERTTTICGALFQAGQFNTSNLLELPFPVGSILPDPPADQSFETDFQRISLYGYESWRVWEPVQLTIGLTYDHLVFPQNFRSAPLTEGTETTDAWSPKAGIVWTPGSNTVVRAAWSRSLGGASLDQSLRLEPTEVAGFNQSFRSLIPESVAGSIAGARFETFGLSLEQRFPTGTYLGLSGELLKSKADQTIGFYGLTNDVPLIPDADIAQVANMREHFDYEERSLLFTVDQLVGPWLSLGLHYRLSYARLQDDLVAFGDSIIISTDYPVTPKYRPEAVLQQLTLQAVLNHPSGLYAGVFGTWYSQDNYGTTAPPGDSFWQVNLLAGYRSPRRRVDLQVGVLNLTGQDYKLNPLNLYNELPHTRTFVTRLQFNL